MEPTNVIDIRHPEHTENEVLWVKYGNAYDAGKAFVEDYVEKFSKREDDTDFTNRKKYSYTPAFAKSAINEIKNAIFQRITDVTREGGSASYDAAFKGQRGGVDLAGSSMSSFIGRQILPELLVKGKVGTWIDMPQILGDSKGSVGSAHPYLYVYNAEDILSWEIEYNIDGYRFITLLLREEVDTIDNVYGLPDGSATRYRYASVVVDDAGNESVEVSFYDTDGAQIDQDGFASETIYPINMSMIPFVVSELTQSLMVDVADYQVSMVNLASSDMSYSLRSNFPFYVEQIDPRFTNPYTRKNDSTENNTAAEAKVSKKSSEAVGASSGRQYPMSANQPAFIHPSPEPLEASMKKQSDLKREIKELVHLALTNVEPKMASAESKAQDQTGLEAGLSYVGLELETMERMIARIWSLYEGVDNEVTIHYPQQYSIKSDEEKMKEAESLKKLMHDAPSDTYKKEIAKRIISITLGDKVSASSLKKMLKEVDNASIVDVDPVVIAKDVEAGLVSAKDASLARGYPEGTVAQAQIEHADRLARIALAQSDGNTDATAEANAGKRSKESSRSSELDGNVRDKTRGAANE